MIGGLVVVGTTVAGGVVGGYAGLFAAMAWADLGDLGIGALTWVAGGSVAGAVAGAFVGGSLL